MLVAFLLSWVDYLMWAGIAMLLVTIIFWSLSFYAWGEKEIDHKEFTKISTVTGIYMFLAISIMCIPSPERVATVMALMNPGTKVEVAKLTAQEEVQVKANTSLVPVMTLDVSGVNSLFLVK